MKLILSIVEPLEMLTKIRATVPILHQAHTFKLANFVAGVNWANDLHLADWVQALASIISVVFSVLALGISLRANDLASKTQAETKKNLADQLEINRAEHSSRLITEFKENLSQTILDTGFGVSKGNYVLEDILSNICYAEECNYVGEGKNRHQHYLRTGTIKVKTGQHPAFYHPATFYESREDSGLLIECCRDFENIIIAIQNGKADEQKIYNELEQYLEGIFLIFDSTRESRMWLKEAFPNYFAKLNALAPSVFAENTKPAHRKFEAKLSDASNFPSSEHDLLRVKA